jgi:DNA (cytosine-5)-methyltransferase 1
MAHRRRTVRSESNFTLFEFDRAQRALDSLREVDVLSAPKRRSVPLVSFFSGAGFLDLGFERSGFQTIWRNEFDRDFADASTYALHALYGQERSYTDVCSIVGLGPGAILKNAFGAGGRPSVFGVVGGPPCPDFSVGGKNRGGEGERGRLTEVYCNRISELEPTFFVLENVRGILSTAKHRAFLQLQLDRLRPAYDVRVRILNALDFGVPQDRERVFVVGFSRRWIRRALGDRRATTLPTFRWPTIREYDAAKSRFSWPDTNPFGADARLPAGVPKELTVWGAIGDISAIRALPNGRDCFRPYSEKFLNVPEGDDSRKSFKRLHRWRYSPTVAYGNNEVHLHPTEPRRISVREALRLQSVPDGYAFPEKLSLTAKFKMTGNGVPPKLAHALAESIACAMEEAAK